jgi:hypothetical protein
MKAGSRQKQEVYPLVAPKNYGLTKKPSPANSSVTANLSVPWLEPLMSILRPFIGVWRKNSPYDTFPFRSAARPYLWPLCRPAALFMTRDPLAHFHANCRGTSRPDPVLPQIPAHRVQG